jgi:hypothetical protein
MTGAIPANPDKVGAETGHGSIATVAVTGPLIKFDFNPYYETMNRLNT